MNVWQLIGLGIAGASLAIGFTVAVTEGVHRFLQWLHPLDDAPCDLTQASDEYLEALAARTLRFPVELGAFGAGVVTGHPSRGSHD